jgi:uncharacterized protein YcgI (DUF1989 family)
MERIVVPAREGRAVELAKGRRLRLITPHGQQAADFFAFSAAAIASSADSAAPCWISSRTRRAACTT